MATQPRSSWILATVFLLFSCNTAAGIRSQAHHDGKSYRHRNDLEADPILKPRQENGPGFGLSALSTPSDSQTAADTLETVSAMADFPFDTSSSTTSSALETLVSSGLATNSTLSMKTLTAPPPIPTTSLPITSSYAFPSTILQVPVATVCPDTPRTSALFTLLPTASMLGLDTNSTTLSSTNASFQVSNVTSVTPQSSPIAINATALLPNGSTIVFLSYVSPSASILNTPNTTETMPTTLETPSTLTPAPAATTPARIVLGSNGCQTLYTPLTTALCSTVITPAGMPSVSVTECGQYITFSSNALAGLCTSLAVLAPSATVSALTNPTALADGGTAYYAAHWLDLAKGGVPSVVKVASCSGTSAPMACSTGSESWSVSMFVTTTTTTGAIHYSGPAVIAQANTNFTTHLSFHTTSTLTHTILLPTVIRQKLVDPTDVEESRTVTVQVTMPTTEAYTLQQGSISTVTVQSTSVVSVGTSTLTIQTTVTETSTVAPTGTMP